MAWTSAPPASGSRSSFFLNGGRHARWLCSYLLAAALFGYLASGFSADAAPAGKCPPIAGLPDKPSVRFLLFGEIHGTNETPEFFGDVVCALSRDHDLVVALELDVLDQAATDAFLRSRGSESDVHALLSAPGWRSPVQDGRTSLAMFKLLDRIRQLGSGAIKVVHFKARSASPDLPQDYYAVRMAGNLASIADTYPKSLILGLMGNVHMRKGPMDFGSMQILPAASHLPSEDVLSFDQDGRGVAWNCWTDCGVHPVTGNEPKARSITLVAGRKDIDGTFSVGRRYTASPPAFKVAPN